MIRMLLRSLGLWIRSEWRRIAAAIPAMRIAPGRSLLASLRAALTGLRQRLRGAYTQLRSGVNVLNLPVIRQYAAWFSKQAGYVQGAVIVLSLALAFLLALAAGRMGLDVPNVQQAKAEVLPSDLAGELYRWTQTQPGAPGFACGAFESQAACQLRRAAEAATYQGRFDAYVRQAQGEQQKAVWTRTGDAFPKFDAKGNLAFAFALEGKAQGDAKTCTPTRILATMPQGIITGVWPDQGDAASKAKPFAHPCLRAPDWKAVVRVDSETAKLWDQRAKAEGWRLEMFYRLAEWQSALRDGWGGDSLLLGDDLLTERKMRLWVDEVRLVIGDLVVQRWR